MMVDAKQRARDFALQIFADQQAGKFVVEAARPLADHLAELEAEVERLTRERDHHSDLREKYLAEALSALEPAAPEGQQPVAWMRRWAFDGIDVMKIDKPSRPVGWQFHAVSEVKILPDDIPLYTRPAEQAVTDAMVEAVQRIRKTAMRQSVVARIPECGEFGGIAQDADWLLDALKAAMEPSHE